MKCLYVLLILLCLGFVADSQAASFQSLSKALSYNNVTKFSHNPRKTKPVKSSSTNKKRQETVKTVKNEEVDLTARYSGTVTLKAGDTVAVSVLEDPCCEWKISYDKNKLSLVGNNIKNKVRTFTLRQRMGEKSQIALDNIKKEDGDYYQNKLVTVVGAE